MRVRDVAEHNVMIYERTRAVECVLIIAARSVHKHCILRIYETNTYLRVQYDKLYEMRRITICCS